MTERYRVFFGFKKEPFAQDIRVEDMMKSPSLKGVQERFSFAVNLGAIAVVTGDVGSGKSSALRYASSKLHPSEFKILHVTATSGTIVELYRQICYALDINAKGSSKAAFTKIIRASLLDLVHKKRKPVLIIDEASLIRLDAFAELHTLTQFEGDSLPVLPIILAGQNNLIDNLTFRQSRPLASRVVARSHMETLSSEEMAQYLQHHLVIAGCKQNVFAEQAITAIHQGSGGLLRRANNLARGALMAAAMEKCNVASAEHVRIASTEII
ncbi:MAG: AAA family ATPase [Actinomycetota bacterium]|nr:AAA family ATPase [Nitrospiraceae bacterium]MDA8156388.1 AAA family ATPase [Actinomycetota bacterium]